MFLAGPIEFSTGEIVLILVVMALMALVLPVLAGLGAVFVYRRRTPEVERTPREAWILFFKTAAIALLAQIGVAMLVGWIQELIG